VDGVDPVANVYSVGDEFGSAFSYGDLTQILDLILANTGVGGRLPNLRVINVSLGPATPDYESILIRHLAPGATMTPGCVFTRKSSCIPDKCGPNQNATCALSNCGELANDDGLPGSNKSCSMNNDDLWLTGFEQLGKVARDVADVAAAQNVLIVQAAGNESDDYCVPLSIAPKDP